MRKLVFDKYQRFYKLSKLQLQALFSLGSFTTLYFKWGLFAAVYPISTNIFETSKRYLYLSIPKFVVNRCWGPWFPRPGWTSPLVLGHSLKAKSRRANLSFRWVELLLSWSLKQMNQTEKQGPRVHPWDKKGQRILSTLVRKIQNQKKCNVAPKQEPCSCWPGLSKLSHLLYIVILP